jgi:hypothetical protein
MTTLGAQVPLEGTREALGPIGQQRRPEPPEHLSKEAAEVWREVVGATRVDWFGVETWPLLEQYCRHACLARLIAKAIPEALSHQRWTAVG